ncbi:MAG TPA: hypothetical protein VEA60_11150 [Allosphingosinicella sp.]|nr:hypothetical protein [Allosphingosinicella sp.]
MPSFSRRLRAAAVIALGLAAAGTQALAQNETSNTIGNPQLKDFTLPGQRTTPPAAVPPPVTTTPPPAATAPRNLPAPAPPPRREPAAAEPRPTEARRGEARASDVPAAPAPVAAAPAETAPTPLPATPVEPLPAAPASPLPAPAPEGAGWLWPVVGGALVLLLGAVLLLRRHRAGIERERARDSARDEIGGALVAAPKPPPEPEPPAAPRPRLELDIVPERAAATDSEAVVHYALTLTNQGDAEARNIRIDPRLFNAGAEAEMADFFQGPIHDLSGSPQVVIPPGGTLKLNSQVSMPKAELREIEMAGRRIFVPMVAINVAYDWAGGGSGRTSRSWLVGREAETPQAKMGPFRLDLGPRIYRSVGRREARLVRV